MNPFDLPEPDGLRMHGLDVSGDHSYLVVYDNPDHAEEVGRLLGKPVKHSKARRVTKSSWKTISVVVLKRFKKGEAK